MTFLRRPHRLCLFVLFAITCRSSLWAAVVVDAPQTITHRVVVQPIRTRNTAGASAGMFGTTTQDTYIKEQINRVWAQVGVRIDWLASVDYANNFAYEGSSGAGTRPTNDLFTILDNAPSPPKSSNVRVLNLFFVLNCPGFSPVSENTANGLGVVDGNGITVHVGQNLLGFTNGLDLIAGVVAHEIGHNLGLEHVGNGDNLMAASNASSSRLTTAQKTTIFTDNPGADGFPLLQAATSGSNYSQWASANGVTQGPTGDDDKDGISNVLEFMFTLNPKAPSTLPVPVYAANGMTWTITKRPEAVADGLVYQMQTSADLTAWVNAGTTGSGSTVVTDNATTLSVRLGNNLGRRFMRLNVVIPAGL